ncbi:Receptor-interacting serine/threonine-protein kinase 3 [Tulasnella sp. 424]|nr:Receptor-interacting serine/threonine-protein kinase 3 [Tulasnella sp. 424]
MHIWLQLQGASTGLAYLHGLDPSIAHGGLKPENILILDDLTAALCDFGTSRVLVDLGLPTGTTAGAGAGTAVYQARELILGESPPTPASDVYAMAGVILVTLSGKVPFWQEKTASVVFIRVCMGRKCDPIYHPELPANDPLWELLSQCWEPEPVDRPSANEVIQNLQSAIQRELELTAAIY